MKKNLGKGGKKANGGSSRSGRISRGKSERGAVGSQERVMGFLKGTVQRTQGSGLGMPRSGNSDTDGHGNTGSRPVSGSSNIDSDHRDSSPASAVNPAVLPALKTGQSTESATVDNHEGKLDLNNNAVSNVMQQIMEAFRDQRVNQWRNPHYMTPKLSPIIDQMRNMLMTTNSIVLGPLIKSQFAGILAPMKAKAVELGDIYFERAMQDIDNGRQAVPAPVHERYQPDEAGDGADAYV